MPQQVEFKYTIGNIIKIVEDNLNTQLEQYLSDIQSEVKTLQAQGLSENDIVSRLADEFKSKSGIFKNLEGRLGGIIDFGVYQTSNLVSNQAVAGVSDKYQWQLEPSAEHCDTCQQRSGQIKTWQEWEAEGLPGAFFRSGNVGTVCGWYCKCSLTPA